jgi:hypothetical protein
MQGGHDAVIAAPADVTAVNTEGDRTAHEMRYLTTLRGHVTLPPRLNKSNSQHSIFTSYFISCFNLRAVRD